MSTLFVSACRHCYPRLDKSTCVIFLVPWLVSTRRGDGSSRRRRHRPVRGTAESANPCGSSPASRAYPRRAWRRLPWPHAAYPAQRQKRSTSSRARPLSVAARSECDMLTSRTSARLPAFALTLADRRRLRSSLLSAAESERE
jgi:hypothetical protein